MARRARLLLAAAAAAVAVAVAAMPACASASTPPDAQLLQFALTSPEAAYDAWRESHGKPSPASPSERSARLSAFRQNAAFIAAHNKQHEQQNGASSLPAEPARLALNAYADLTWEEFSRTRLGYRPRGSSGGSSNNNKAAVAASSPLSAPPPSARLPGFMHEKRVPPPQIDWRERGAVSPVSNQGACGSCWAWSATGAIEGANALASMSDEDAEEDDEKNTPKEKKKSAPSTKTPSFAEPLSVQEIVDCDTQGQDSGCGGGLMDSAFDFVVASGGLDTAADYGYYSSWGLPLSWCNHRKLADRRVVSIDGYQDVPADDEEALLKAASAQPVAVAICASPALQFYSGGVFGIPGTAMGGCCEELNHGVLVVGYDRESWIVKNSWGGGWGEEGYFRLARVAAAKGGSDNNNHNNNINAHSSSSSSSSSSGKPPTTTKGLCGITDAASFPIKKRGEGNPRVPSSCDAFAWAECPYSQTCGCNWRLPPPFSSFFPQVCIRHDCCPHPNGVDSCGDGVHCCPGDKPVCDPGRGVCVRSAEDAEVAEDEGAVPWLGKVPANYSWGWAEQQEVMRAAQQKQQPGAGALAAAAARAVRRALVPEVAVAAS